MQTIKTVKMAWFLSMLLCLGLASAQAQTVTNADTSSALSAGGSWVLGTPPISTQIAVWDNTITNNTAKVLGGSLSWLGIQILNPATNSGAPIIIETNTTIPGNILTLGASGIDMSAASANLSLSNAVVLGANQTWNVATGYALTNSGVISGSANLTLNNGANYGGAVI